MPITNNREGRATFSTTVANTVIMNDLQANNGASYFNSNGTSIAAGFITLNTPQGFANGDRLYYKADTGNTALIGLANNTYYYAVYANSLGTALSATVGGANVAVAANGSINEAGHRLTRYTENVSVAEIRSIQWTGNTTIVRAGNTVFQSNTSGQGMMNFAGTGTALEPATANLAANIVISTTGTVVLDISKR